MSPLLPLTRASASDTHHDSNPGFAIDGNLETHWNSGRTVSITDPPVWISVDLGSAEYLESIRLSVSQAQPGETIHQVELYDDSGLPVYSRILHGYMEEGDVLEISPPYHHPAYRKACNLKILTLSSPAPIGWRDIQAFSGRTPRDTVPPPPGGGFITPEEEFAYLVSQSVVLFEDRSLWYAPPLRQPTLLDANPKTLGIATDGVGYLYQIHDDGAIYKYIGRAGWSRLSDPSQAVAVSVAGDDVYRMASSGAVDWYNYGTRKWSAIDLHFSVGGVPQADQTSRVVGFCAQLGGFVWVMVEDTGHLFRGGPGKQLELLGATGIKQVTSLGKDIYRLRKNGVIDKFVEPGGWLTIDSDPNNVAIFGGQSIIKLRSDGAFAAFDSTTLTTIPIGEGDIRSGIAQYTGALNSRFSHEIDKLKTAVGLNNPMTPVVGGAVASCLPTLAAQSKNLPLLEPLILCLAGVTFAVITYLQIPKIQQQTPNGQLPQTTPRPFEGHDTMAEPSHGTPGPRGPGNITVCPDDTGKNHCND